MSIICDKVSHFWFISCISNKPRCLHNRQKDNKSVFWLLLLIFIWDVFVSNPELRLVNVLCLALNAAAFAAFFRCIIFEYNRGEINFEPTYISRSRMERCSNRGKSWLRRERERERKRGRVWLWRQALPTYLMNEKCAPWITRRTSLCYAINTVSLLIV